MDVVAMVSDCVVRVINERTNRIVEEHKDLTEVQAYRVAKQIAEGFARDYGDDVAHAERDFPFVPDILASIDPYQVLVLQRDEDRVLNWRGCREIVDGFVTATGRCAY
jgi:hypothetical protein